MTTACDILVVGAGFAGSVLAERFASQRDRKVVILERRDHIAGNAFDYANDAGILVHKYGPKIFRTDAESVWSYLQQFTSFNGYEHHVCALVDGKLLPVPFNLTALEMIFAPELAAPLKEKLVAAYGMGGTVPVAALRRHSDRALAGLGELIFKKIYLNYTLKQWGEPPERLDFATITERVPVRVTYDNRYFLQCHQGLPQDGYTRMFERMLAHPNIEVRLGVDATTLLTLDLASGRIAFEGRPFAGLVIYTGPLDELFGYVHGELPYRSLEFEVKTLARDRFQPVGVVNYPNEQAYTRITEFKTLTRQEVCGVTTIAEEYPLPFNRHGARGREPYYPIPAPKNANLIARYLETAQRFPQLYPIGRLAEYRYYDMNDIILRALAAFAQLGRRLALTEDAP